MPQPTAQPTTHRRWTEDTRVAFLLGLRLTGTAIRAAREIGRKPAVCYRVREREPDFAAAWDAIVAELRAARSRARRIGPGATGAASVPGGAPASELDAASKRRRRDGLTNVKRRTFLRALSETGTVEAACRAASVSDTAAYRLRGDDADFATAWDRALRTAAPALAQVAWERAVEGWEEPVFRGTEQVGTRRRYSETLLRQLLVTREKAAALADDPASLRKRAEAAARAAGGWFVTPASREETNATIMAKLAKIEGRLGLPPLQARAGEVDEGRVIGGEGDGGGGGDEAEQHGCGG